MTNAVSNNNTTITNSDISSCSTPTSIPNATPSSTPHVIMTDKKGRSTSCYLCQKRKQKCDQRSPSCTNCLKSKFQCIKPPRYGENKNEVSNANNDYTKFLEKKVKQLEKLLDLKINSNNSLNSNQPPKKKSTLNDEKILKYKKISPLIDTSSNDLPESDPINIPYENFIKINSSCFKNSILKKYQLLEFIELDPILNIDEKFSKNLINLYFKMLQYKFPILNEDEIIKFHNNYYYNNNTNNNNSFINNDEIDYFNCSRIYFIYAISSLFVKSTGKYKGPNPFNFFSTGLRYMILLSNNIKDFNKIELLILICMFLIRADKNSNNFYLVISDAMNTCINLKLNKLKSYQNLSIIEKDLKMRKFWCCYILERSISISLSKPFILLESKIDKSLPLFDYEPSNVINNNGKIFFINQAIKIKRIDSSFMENLNPTPSKDQLPKVESYFQDLQNWRNECQGFNNNDIENQTLLFYYYKSIRHLIQPYLELLDPNDKLFKECQAAAGQICQSIKNYHSKTFYGFSMLNIHLTFVAGITLIYCLWLQRNRDDMRRKLLGDDKKHTRPTVNEDLFRGLDDLRSCSISLYVMTERTKFALNFRDIFEEIMNATIGNLILRCGPDSSEILYRGIGLPPAIFRKPLKHFQIETNYIEKSDADKLEDEERLKRKGQLTKSAIPKGLSHLLLHPPGFEDHKQKQNENAKKVRGKSAQETETDNKSEIQREKEKEDDDINRILPLPIKLPSLQPQNRLPSSLNSKNFENDLKSISKTHISLKRKYSKTDSDNESMISNFSKSSNSNLNNNNNNNNNNNIHLPNALSPLLRSNYSPSIPSPSPSQLSTMHMMNSSMTCPLNHLHEDPLSSNNVRIKITKSPDLNLNNSNRNISTNLNPATSTSNTSATPDSESSSITSTILNDNLIQNNNNNNIPSLFPFVGGTTTMISNISTWTEQSGQQVPQTGLQMYQNSDDVNNIQTNEYNQNHINNNLNNNNNNNTTNNNNNNSYNNTLMNQGNHSQQNSAPMFNSMINGNYNLPNHTQNIPIQYNNNTNTQIVHPNSHPHSNYLYPNNNLPIGTPQTMYKPSSGPAGGTTYNTNNNTNVNENFNNLFDVVSNDEFWNFNNDLGFLP